MDISTLLVQLAIALVCAGLATVLLPRRIPGKLAGLILIGLGGVWLGSWAAELFRQRFGLDLPFLHWDFQGVPIIPSVLGSTVILYVVTTLLKWGHYE
ncbi:MAG: hypothetical protein IGR76_02470 [Synechococcales cyanobacterium T60_A2020_003]|nr:hypothetical protein [Synechococcales cyanobacterium T60_A2020_003]